MLIEIQCGNFSNYDEGTGTYMTCAEKQIVSSDQAGQIVKCSKCGQDIEVPLGIGTTRRKRDSAEPEAGAVADQAAGQKREKVKRQKPVSVAGEAPQKARRRRKSSDAETGEKAARKRSTQSSSGSAKSRSSKSRSETPGKSRTKSARSKSGASSKAGASRRRKSESDELSLESPTIRPKADVMSMDFNDASTVANATTERCKKCGNESVEGRCTVCRHVEQRFEKMHQDLGEIKIENVGFQRWFCETMNEGVSIKVLEYASHALLGFLALMLTGAGIICLTGQGFGVPGGIVILTMVALLTALYCGLIFKGYQFQRDPRARLSWFQKPFWNFVLMCARMTNWQGYDSRLKGRKIIKSRDSMFGDIELVEHPDLKNCSVLDVQGTRVSDRGLKELYRLKHLRVVVVKGADVSHEAIFRLQQSVPRLWIWY